jgi:endonuclease/exonuclease/phosphatase (EEP) superfamily protein YafD|tara:strand:- start:393 stop:1361 length:969 start_codon:yes stop_codon:yes gene_type:complete
MQKLKGIKIIHICKYLFLFFFLLSYIFSRLDTQILWIDLFDQLSFQILIGGILLTIIFLTFQKFLIATVYGLVCILLAFQILIPCNNCRAFIDDNLQSTKKIRLMTFNTSYSYYDSNDFDKIVELILKKEIDIIILQEVSTQFQKKLINLEKFFHYNVNLNKSIGFRDNIILSKYPLIDSPVKKNDYIMVNCLLDGTELTIIAIHLYPPISQAFFNSRLKTIAELKELIKNNKNNIILAGDLNMTPVSKRFTNFLEETNLYTFTSFIKPTFTWPTFLPSILGIQIDHVLFSEKLKMIKKQTINHFDSDHRPLLVDLYFDNKD